LNTEFSELSDVVSRKDAIINLLAMPIAATAVIASAQAASAAPGLDPTAVQYQNKPKDGKKCSGCALYVPAKSNPATANGSCKQVKGEISPNGWCAIWSAKAK
jgi:hypothetical protein